jgi:hypothetical protein
MDIIIDGTPGYPFGELPADLIGVLKGIEEGTRADGRGITQIVVDGEEILPEDVMEKMGDKAVDTVGSVLITTRSLNEMVRDCLSRMRETVRELPGLCRSLAEVFQSDTPEDGFEPFQRLAEIWHIIKQNELHVASTIGLDLENTPVEGKALRESHMELNTYLGECIGALEAGDTVLIGDLLEYELAPRAESEAHILATLEQHAGISA